MEKIHTHYDNLKVSRNAPIDVIRAAYKVLANKYHPDRNNNSSEAARIMSIINSSYEVLSNIDERIKYDQALAKKEHLSKNTSDKLSQSMPVYQAAPPTIPEYKSYSVSPISKSHKRNNDRQTVILLFSVSITALIIFAWFGGKSKVPKPQESSIKYVPLVVAESAKQKITNVKSNTPTEPKVVNLQWSIPKVSENKVEIKPEYVRPNEAPNGTPWPTSANYLEGYEKLNQDGLSSVTIDNGINYSDVYVKLVFVNNNKLNVVRQIYIPALGKFTMSSISEGNYKINYMDIGSGDKFRSEIFELKEYEVNNVGTEFSNVTLTLYKVSNGNTHMYPLSEEEFDLDK